MSFVRRPNIAASPYSGAKEQLAAAARRLPDDETYLEALPIPAAIFRLGDEGFRFDTGNRAFKLLVHGKGDQDMGQWLRSESMLARSLQSFFGSGEERHQFEWVEGEGICRRYYTVGLSRLPGTEGKPADCLMTLIDRTAAIEAERSLRAEMLRDSLTGLPNRTAFIEAVDGSIEADAGQSAFAVLIVDLTRFSRVNESMGSLAGDELIITVARRLVSALRAGDLLARLGDDEFGILLNLHDGPGDALHAARRIHTALATPFRLSELEIRIDCAIGCSLMSETIKISEDLVRNAQFALKRAKISGRVEVYQPGEVAVARRRFSLETELRRAIEGGDLTLAYQPLIDLQADRIAGFEALARWDHLKYGSVSPTDFVSVAEESGLIVPLGRWAINEATRTLASWDKAAGQILPIYVSVNVSAVQLVRDDVAAVVRSALVDNGLHGSRLVLELTESAIIADPERSAKLLGQLKAMDTTIAMDDFGTGYSSLAYLQRLPIDVLKIDRSFVTGMLGDRDSVAIIRAILSLASALGMHTTAEGVETVELANTLAALGCSYAQGYHYSHPLGPDEALAYCAKFDLFKSAA
jgi:diguanylate cyclase (GGDEF)-like protein